MAGVSLVPATPQDEPFLIALYASFRAAEMALVPWSAAEKQSFVADQFRLQHLHFIRHFAHADFWLVTRVATPVAAAPIGRLYLDRSGMMWRIVDIGLMPQARRGGLGTGLIRWVQGRARSAGARGVALNVALTNMQARSLYRRLGFVESEQPENMHQPMVWMANGPGPSS